MKIILALVGLMCSMFAAFAQNSASVKGFVADSLSKSPLEYATVALVNASDTSLVSYTVTKKDGSFELSRMPTNRELRLIISYVGYQTFRRSLVLKRGVLDLKQIGLVGRSLEEVVVRGERSPVQVKKDTIEFSTEAFKTRPNAVVEELLKLLPGVQVNQSGEVFVNGKETRRILIDGKEFFGENQLIALRNLDADMIDKIQVYLDREDDPDNKQNEINLQNIINLKLKSAVKKSTIGKFMGGVGTRERYQASGIVSSFRDTLQFSLMGAANNLNSTGFSDDDLQSMGGFNRSGGIEAPNGSFGGGWGGGLVNVKSGGININNDYGKTLKLNLGYFYGNTVNTNTSKDLNEQFLENNLLTSLQNSDSERNATTQVLSGLAEWKPDTTRTLRYRPALTLSPSRYNQSSFLTRSNTLVGQLSDQTGGQDNRSGNDAFSHNLTFYKRFKKGRSFTVTNLLNLNASNSDIYNYNNLISYTDEIPSSTLDRYTSSGSKTNWTGVTLLYNLPLTKKLTAEFFTNSRYYYWGEPLRTFDKNTATGNYDQLIQDQSNHFERLGFFQNVKPLLNYQVTDKLRLRVALDLEIQDVLNKFNSSVEDIRHRFAVLFPALSVDYSGFSLSYSEWINIPDIRAIQPIVRQSSQQFVEIGNPDLRPSRQRNASANFYKYIASRLISVNGYANSSFNANSFVQQTLIDDKGFTTFTMINKGNSVYANGGGSVGKEFKKSQQFQVSIRSSFSTSLNRRLIYLNAEETRQLSRWLTLTQDLNLNYKSAAMLNLSYQYITNKVKYLDVDYESVSNYTHVLRASNMLRLPKRIVVNANYSYAYNPEVPLGFPKSSHIVNLSLSLLTHKKDRGQLELSVYDLLDQNIAVRRYGYLNAINTNEQLILKRYVMLKYQYRFSIFKNK